MPYFFHDPAPSPSAIVYPSSSRGLLWQETHSIAGCCARKPLLLGYLCLSRSWELRAWPGVSRTKPQWVWVTLAQPLLALQREGTYWARRCVSRKHLFFFLIF